MEDKKYIPVDRETYITSIDDLLRGIYDVCDKCNIPIASFKLEMQNGYTTEQLQNMRDKIRFICGNNTVSLKSDMNWNTGLLELDVPERKIKLYTSGNKIGLVNNDSIATVLDDFFIDDEMLSWEFRDTYEIVSVDGEIKEVKMRIPNLYDVHNIDKLVMNYRKLDSLGSFAQYVGCRYIDISGCNTSEAMNANFLLFKSAVITATVGCNMDNVRTLDYAFSEMRELRQIDLGKNEFPNLKSAKGAFKFGLIDDEEKAKVYITRKAFEKLSELGVGFEEAQVIFND